MDDLKNDLKNNRRLGRRMITVYQEVDPGLQDRAKEAGARCSKGCAACCYLAMNLRFPEAVLLAEKILRGEIPGVDVQRASRLLYVQATMRVEALKDPDPNRFYFEKRFPCIMLDTADKTCRAYAWRPTGCRTHFVVSDPSLCSPSVEAEITMVNTLDFVEEVNDEVEHVCKQVGIRNYYAPFPIALLWGLKLLAEGRQKFDEALGDKEIGPLNITWWNTLARLSPGEVRAEPAPVPTPPEPPQPEPPALPDPSGL